VDEIGLRKVCYFPIDADAHGKFVLESLSEFGPLT